MTNTIIKGAGSAVLYVWRVFVPMTAVGVFLALLMIRLAAAATR